MAPHLYFAYGSNMLTARLQARCPSAVPLAVAKAEGHTFIYGKRGQDGSGKATLVPCEGGTAYGVLFQVSDADMSVLDAFEGRGRGYERDDGFIVTNISTAAKVTASTYLAPKEFIDVSLMPFDWYHALILAGAAEHDLPGHYVAGKIVPARETLRDRAAKGAAEALQILEKAQVSDFSS